MQDRDPVPSGMRPILVALSFTTILIQVQAAAQGGVHDLLPVLVAALVMLAGLVLPKRPEI
jgi:hypothetical protein